MCCFTSFSPRLFLGYVLVFVLYRGSGCLPCVVLLNVRYQPRRMFVALYTFEYLCSVASSLGSRVTRIVKVNFSKGFHQ